MKIAVFVTLLSVTSASSQTNLGTITFTNKGGVVLSNVTVTKTDGVRLTYAVPAGVGGGVVQLADLPGEMQKRFGYDPEKSVLAAAKEAGIRQRDRQQQIAVAEAEADKKLREEVKGKANFLGGTVLQKVDGGLLVQWSQTTIYFLEDHPRYKDLLDGDTVRLAPRATSISMPIGSYEFNMWPIGSYEYVTVVGTKSTIRKFTCDIERAILDRRLNGTPKP